MFYNYQFCEFSLSHCHLSAETGSLLIANDSCWLKIPIQNDITSMQKRFKYALLYFTLFYLVLPCFTLFYLVLPCFTLFYLNSKESKSVLIFSLTLAVFALLPILQIFIKSQLPIGRNWQLTNRNWFLFTKNSSSKWHHFNAKKVQICSTLFYLVLPCFTLFYLVLS